MKRSLKIFLSLTAIFGLGVASGVLVTVRLRPAPVIAPSAAAPEERWRSLTLADYEQRLALTPEQVGRLKPMFGLTSRKLAALRANTAERIADLLREMNAQIAQELDETQRAKLRALLEERRKNIYSGR